MHGVHLTQIGEAYAADISRVLGEVVAVTEGVRSWSGPRQITIACSRGIADQWFMPRLMRLQQDIPGLELRLNVTDDIVHLRLDEFDLALFYRSERPVGVNLTVLGREEIVPVAAPGFAPLVDAPDPVTIGIEDTMREWQAGHIGGAARVWPRPRGSGTGCWAIMGFALPRPCKAAAMCWAGPG